MSWRRSFHLLQATRPAVKMGLHAARRLQSWWRSRLPSQAPLELATIRGFASWTADACHVCYHCCICGSGRHVLHGEFRSLACRRRLIHRPFWCCPWACTSSELPVGFWSPIFSIPFGCIAGAEHEPARWPQTPRRDRQAVPRERSFAHYV